MNDTKGPSVAGALRRSSPVWTALAGLVVGIVSLAAVTAAHPGMVFDMDRMLPRFFGGFSPSESDGRTSFAWTSGRGIVRLSGLDRRDAWDCRIRLRGARPPGVEQPLVQIAVDDAVVASARSSNEYEAIAFAIPPGRERRARVTFTSAPTFTPGGSDPRELGVQVDSLACAPRHSIVLPGWPATLMAGASTAALAGALALIGVAILPAIVVAGVLGLGQAVTLSQPAALYGGYAETALTAAIWIALAVTVVARALSWLKGSPLAPTAQFALGASAALLWLELLALLHPLKPLVDALFQAHRLEWVMAGRYFFTQPMPDGVEFPYAIALYAFAAPWTLVAADHVALLRVVVMTLQAVAGACLYPMAARAWDDRRAGVVAVLLFHLIPLPYVVIGNGNLTNMFGQSVALASIAIIVVTALRPSRLTAVAALSLVVALGLLAHVSTFGLLSGTLVLVAALYGWRGGPAGRASAVAIAVAAMVAAVLSVALYYRHFGEVYAHAIERVAAPAPAVAEDVQPAAPNDSQDPPTQSRLSRARLGVAAGQTAANIGGPVLVLAILGAPAVVRARDRLSLAVMAWVALWSLGTAAVLMTRVGPEFERYAVEFLGRINLATYPAAVLLAARACSGAWARRREGTAGAARVLGALVLLAWAAKVGIDSWLNWMR